LPIWVKKTPKDFPKEKVEIIDGNCQINNLVNKSNLQSFTTDCRRSSTIQINTAYYPGWKIKLNSIDITNQIKNNLTSSNGMMKFSVPKNTNQVVALFQDTPLRRITKYLSVFFWLLSIYLLLKNKFKLS